VAAEGSVVRRLAFPATALTCALVVAAHVALISAGGTLATRANDVTQCLAAFAAAVACLRAAGREVHPTQRAGWRLLAAGCLSWGLGQLVRSVYELGLHRSLPFPSLADIGFVAFVPLSAWGLMLFVRAPSRGALRLRGMVEALLIGCSLLLTAWATVLPSVIEQSGRTGLSFALSVGGLFGALVLIAVAVFGFARTSSAHRASMALVSLGILVIAVADAGFAYVTATGDLTDTRPLDIGRVVGFVLVLVAAVQARAVAAVPVRTSTGGYGLALPYVPVVVALVASVVAQTRGHSLGPIGLSNAAVIVGVLLAHVWSLMRENNELTHYLQGLVEERTGQLAARERYYRSLTENATDVVTVVLDGRITYQSPSGERLHGRSAYDLIGVPFVDLVLEADQAPVVAALRAAGPEAPVSIELRMADVDDGVRYLDTTVVPLTDGQGLLLTSRDVTDQVALRTALAHRATHDALTGLPQRAVLRDRTGHLLDEQAELALLLIDFDDFSQVNDGYGRARGDELLRTLGATMRTTVSAADVVSRLGGDEFAVLVPGATPREALVVAQQLLEAISAPVTIEGREIVLEARIGISTTETSARQVDQLFRDADRALFAAKHGESRRVVVYDEAIQAAELDRVQLRADLRHAIDHDQMFLQYQPVIALETGRLTGVEALVRWRHPERGVVPPLDFISLAEDTGLIIPLGRWVLQEACRSAVLWRERVMGGEFTLSVNVSARQLRDPHFVVDLAEILAETGFAPEALVVEITESVLLTDLASTAMRLAALHAIGVRVAIDDFGTGYSSLSYLHQLPLDILKIDRSFVSGVTENGAKTALTRTVLDLARSLGLATIAEGIETEEQRDALLAMGCQEAQGFLFARPLDGDRLAALLGVPAIA
jgi:diguanylate cyclase (GGDEF)-like protein/PAS domain S-box-containing protein